ncbi:hypothetical protein RHEC894_PC00082 (plasmid) [Rhizobium sp. CIAT894]|uniref:hypothetical protein n=1 Tax=Rhizobium sp. CIAT894 TaxID=2020312 RepID=UPI000A1F9597|nr:hypothetical protein [Rhizobium sp. CIAT894]ARM91117.1 hypothetical protein RHEC894_PC00082 [Rhizobium sp. CIAT894]
MVSHDTAIIIVPDIPASDLTQLERLVLSLGIDAVEMEDGVRFQSWEGSSNIVSIDADELRASWSASQLVDSRLNPTVANSLAAFDAADEADRTSCIDIHLSDAAVAEILQDIVRRSPTLHEISLMRSVIGTQSGFGGSMTRITADVIQRYSADDVDGMPKDIPT